VADARGPVFSPDGARVAFYGSVDGATAVLVMAVEGEEPVVVSRGITLDELSLETPPTWSPASDRIAFTGFDGVEHRVYVADADGSETRPIGAAGMSRIDPAWSPDGAWIAFQGTRPEDQKPLGPYHVVAGLYIIRPDGSDETLLIDGSGGSWIFRKPQWRPDPAAPMLAYMVGQPSAYDIVVYDFATRSQHDVSTEFAAEVWPVWSPDGSQLAWSSSDVVIRVAKPDGTLVHESSAGLDYSFVWSPDGRYLLGWTTEGRDALAVLEVGNEAPAVTVKMNGRSQSHWSWQRRAP
jgi:Tol biopolymer transport system component